MRYLTCLVFALVAFALPMQAQVISLDDAINEALANNLSIQIAKNQTEISSNNVTKGNAGALPSLSAGGSYSGSLTNTKLVFAGNAQPPIEVDGAQAGTLSGNLTAQYVLFNGFLAGNTFDKLQSQASLGQVQEQMQIESTLLGVINAYFLTLQIQQNLESARTSLEISERRYERASLRAEFGSATNIAKLNAEVDLNNDSIVILSLEQQLANAKSNLLYLMGSTEITDFEVKPDFDLTQLESKEAILTKSLEQNTSVLQARTNLEISEKDVDLSRATLYPNLSISTAYQYNSNLSDANFITENRSAGLNGGLSLSYALFNGSQSSIKRENALINWENSRLKEEDSRALLQIQVNNAYTSYTNEVAIYQLRKKALEVNKLNFSRSEELFKNGQITGTEFREAQLNLVNAEVQENLSKISAKLSEYELLRLSGELVSSSQL